MASSAAGVSDATVGYVTGTEKHAGAGTLLFSAYHRPVTWTGERLRDARGRRGWTQQELADRIGAAKRSVTSWEAGDATPMAAYATKLDTLFADELTSEDVTDSQPLTYAEQEDVVRQLDDLVLVAEVTRRMAARRVPDGQTPSAVPERFKWSRRSLPSYRRANETMPPGGRQDEHGTQSM